MDGLQHLAPRRCWAMANRRQQLHINGMDAARPCGYSQCAEGPFGPRQLVCIVRSPMGMYVGFLPNAYV